MKGVKLRLKHTKYSTFRVCLLSFKKIYFVFKKSRDLKQI